MIYNICCCYPSKGIGDFVALNIKKIQEKMAEESNNWTAVFLTQIVAEICFPKITSKKSVFKPIFYLLLSENMNKLISK